MGRFQPSTVTYFLLWLLGLANVAFATILVIYTAASQVFQSYGLSATFGVVPGILWSIHLMFVYWSVHGMESKAEKWKNELPTWFNSPVELVIRTLTLLALLFAGGKFAGFISTCDCEDPKRAIEMFNISVLVGNVAVVSLLVLWDILAFSSILEDRRRLRTKLAAGERLPPLDHTTLLFLASDICALVLSISVMNSYTNPDWIAGISTIIPLYFIVIGYRVFVFWATLWRRQQPDILADKPPPAKP